LLKSAHLPGWEIYHRRADWLDWNFVKDVLFHAFLPALSLILLAWLPHQIMRLIVQGVNEEDYVRYAQMGQSTGEVFSST
jgi:ABC-type dipeptide/oligopeptide/nickel transport system permease component